MIHETAKREVSEIQEPSIKPYETIRPHTDISFNEANSYWDQERENGKEYFVRTDTVKEVDDNGEKFRNGDKLLPSKKFEVNGYQYETDSQARVISASGKLRIKDSEYSRNMENVRNKEGQEYRKNDDRGHLIAHLFGGSDKLENLVPMDADLNHGDYARLENTLAEAVKDGADVHLTVEPVYQGDSSRPVEFKVSYVINGEKEVTVFRNGEA